MSAGGEQGGQRFIPKPFLPGYSIGPGAGDAGDVTEQAGVVQSSSCASDRLVAGKRIIPRKTRAGYDKSQEAEYIPDSHPVAMRAYRCHTGRRSLMERQQDTAVKNGRRSKA
ncbi:hypothetical protein NAI64_02720 [Oxalobacter sp. OxGP1]|uniref:hypothetical protein n=1 Tax=Oxalobacter paeniformigenes TaxID=2946594 RepID=UPI0022AF135B|nr:hypothetical protein [Oxalobacter paeniformigenes]MCZ4052637.1 hypothetical protein [Oxalobacter paeniformigenes]